MGVVYKRLRLGIIGGGSCGFQLSGVHRKEVGGSVR